MALVVQKYGGSSVADADGIKRVAQRIVATRKGGDRVVVVVSAMGDSTDELMDLASQVSPLPPARELDMLLTAGERISMALLAMAIATLGLEARSFTGSQAGVITDAAHGRARIIDIKPGRIADALGDGAIPIVAGFQGVSQTTKDVTTMGRGASDTTAVALAAALDADVCEIYTDVDGVFTADPRRVPGARVIPRISHAEMIELASAGAQVMHARAVEIGARFDVDIRVLSSFVEDEEGAAPRGTLITRTPQRMEELALTGITSQRGHAKLVMRGLPAGMATSTEVLTRLAEAGVPVDMISEYVAPGGRVALQVTTWQEALPEARRVVDELVGRLGGEGWEVVERLSRIALVGSGMHGRPGVYAGAFRALLDAEVEVHAVSTSAISITVLVDEAREEAALRALHRAFELEMGAVPAGDAASVR